MPKRSRKRPKRPDTGLDTVQNAKRVLDEAIRRASPEADPAPPSRAVISQVMAQMGRKGGKIGGKRRMDTMTAEQRSALARMAVHARWSKKKRKSAA